MKIAVKDLRPNPFRHLERYPINRDKVDALKQSIKDTDFWDNILSRKAPDGDGFEMAYGHHRYVALKELRIEEIDIPVRKLDDTTMARIMAHENMEEWSWSATIEQETVRAIIEGFGEGRIVLPKVARQNGAGGNVRYAPHFSTEKGATSGRPEVAYSAATLAKFLGWKENKVEVVLNALAVIEKGLVSEKDFEGLTAHQAGEVARQVRRVEKETGKRELAKSVGKRLAGGMRSASGRKPGSGGATGQSITYHGAKHVVDKMIAKERRDTTEKSYPPAGKAIPDLAIKFNDIPSEAMMAKVEQVIAVRGELHQKDIKMLANALRGVAKRVTRLADRLEA